MSKLWEPCEFITFRPSLHSMADVFGHNKNTFLPYRRKYGSLSSSELLELISDAKTNHWQALDLSDCGLTSLPYELSDLDELRILYLGNSGPSVNLPSNNIRLIPRRIERMKQLQALSLKNLNFRVYGDRPLDLPSLVYLELWECGFKRIPKALLIPSIEGIAYRCSEKTLDPGFTSLVGLKELWLDGFNITALPDDFGRFTKLEHLHLWAAMTTLPTSILNLSNLETFDVFGTPLWNNLPPEIREWPAKDIVRYVLDRQSAAPKEFFNEAKMIIVGQGSVGKTTLVSRLVKNKFEEETSTDGLDISRWDFTWNNEQMRLNVWDFGGQEIYHATHQFFLTERSLYLFVWDALSEKEHGRVEYWLKTIQSFANDSPIIIVVNKCDSNNKRIEKIVLKDYKNEYPQILDVLYVSCKDNINIEELRTLIQNTAANLPLMKERWLKTWLDVRTRIEVERESHDLITLERYIEICKENKISDEDEALRLVRYLHDLGVVLNFRDNHLLKGIVILSSEWGTDAVYKILSEKDGLLKGRNGILKRSDLPKIWADHKKYPSRYYPHLLELMEKFQLAITIDQDTYLVAELLNEETLSSETDFNSAGTLSFRYEYDLLPAGVMTRFIVSANRYLVTKDGVKQCWRSGTFLSHRTANARVQLFETKRYIRIDVAGDYSRDKSDLLTIIRDKLDEINSKFKKIVIKQMVPCCCEKNCEYLFDYDFLRKAESKGKAKVQCQKSCEDVDLSKLLDGIEKKHSEYESFGENTYNFITVNQFSSPSSSSRMANQVAHDVIDEPSGICCAAELSDSSTNNVRSQFIEWTNTSPLYKAVIGGAEDYADCLNRALCGEESERCDSSFDMMMKIWAEHPDWGLPPNYKQLSVYEHSGRFYEKYRDHLAHMFRVLLLGLYLYEKSATISRAFDDNGIDKTEFTAIWSITAMYHDIGYTLSTLDDAIDGASSQEVCSDLGKLLSSPLSKLYPNLFSRDTEKTVQRKYKCYVDCDVVYADLYKNIDAFDGFGSSVGLSLIKTGNPIQQYYDLVSKSNTKRSELDHGINSAMILLFMQQSLKEYIESLYAGYKKAQNDDATDDLKSMLSTVEEQFHAMDKLSSRTTKAARALALHNIVKDHSSSFISNLTVSGVSIDRFKISLSTEPLAYLLRICDELQCWDREYKSDPIGKKYLHGNAVRITGDTEPQIHIDDINEQDKIKKALNGIVEPPVETWLDN